MDTGWPARRRRQPSSRFRRSAGENRRTAWSAPPARASSRRPGRDASVLTVEEDASFTANNIVVHNSLSCAVMAPSWSWTVDPSLKWLFSSYAFALATRDSRKCRQIITSQWYRDRWGDRFRLLSDQNLKSRFANDKHGERICTAVRSLLTGEGGDVLVVDDPPQRARRRISHQARGHARMVGREHDLPAERSAHRPQADRRAAGRRARPDRSRAEEGQGNEIRGRGRRLAGAVPAGRVRT